MRNVALIVAAGKGERAGGDLPKQFALLAGKPLVRHSIESFTQHSEIEDIFAVIGAGQEAMFAGAMAGYPVSGIAIGGAERQHSVQSGLDAIAAAGGAQNVLIHDAARPFLPHGVIDRLLDALKAHSGAVPVLPVVDTLARANGALAGTVERSGMVRVQTPQAFRFDDICVAHRNWAGGPATDDAQIVRAAGFDVMTVEGDAVLDKITHPADFAAAETRIAASRISRTGMGYDVHRLETGKPLWLGGIEIPHSAGLAGHSDADVALHAVTDALLGAIGDGDIGTHFPPSDPQWKGAKSHRFVEHARDLIGARGGTIDHVDLTIICEAPKIGPHRAAIRTAIAMMLRVTEDHISIKATTTERLGFTGREEGIAAQAIATVRI